MREVMNNWRDWIDSYTGPDVSHVGIAISELQKFKNGDLKETQREAWPLIAEYATYCGKHSMAKWIKKGFYKFNQPDTWHWSAIFIQYCMKGNKEFQELQNPARPIENHQYYWRDAKLNTEMLVEGQTIAPHSWIMISTRQAAEIGYSESVGDIAMQMQPAGLHGDIVTHKGKVGGNLGHPDPGSVMVTTSPTVHILTQSPDVKKKILDTRG